MFTKTGLRVREINAGRSAFSQGIGQGQGKKVAPPGTPSSTRARATSHQSSLRVQSGKLVADSEAPGANAGIRADHDRAIKLRNESAASAAAAIYGHDPSRSAAGKDVKKLKKAGRTGAGDGARRVPRRRPAWDDSLRDQSEFKLTPEEAAQRKKALVSKHNTLVFGARRNSALVAQDKEAAAAAASAAAAARVAARSAPTQDSEHPRRAASRGRGDSANRNRFGNGSSRRSSSRGKARSQPWSSEGGGKRGTDGAAADEPSTTLASGAASDATVTIVPDTKTPAGSKAVGAMETPRSNAEGILDLSEIELGIRDFSQRVLRLEAGEGEGFRIEVGDSEECTSGMGTTVHEILDESTEKAPSEEACGRYTCSPRSGKVPASAGKERKLSDGVAGRPWGPDSPPKKESILEDEDIVGRIQRLEERVRELQLCDVLHDAEETSNAECVETNEKQSEVQPGKAEGVRSVLEGLLSLSVRLLKRAIAAEQRLREHGLDGDGDDAMVAAICEQDEEATAVLNARGVAILAGMKPGEAVERRAGDAAAVEPNASLSVDEDVVALPPKASGLPEDRERCNDSSPLPSTGRIGGVAELEPNQEFGLETPTTGARIHPRAIAADESPLRKVRERTSSRDVHRVPPTPVSKDCWGEALDAVSTLVSKGPGVPGLEQASRGSLVSPSPTAPSDGVSDAGETVQVSRSQTGKGDEKTGDVPETALSRASVGGSVSAPLQQSHDEEQQCGEGYGIANTAILSRRALAPMCTVGATQRVLHCEPVVVDEEGNGIGGAEANLENLEDVGDGARLASNLLAPTPMEKPEHPFEGRLPSRSSGWVRQQGLVNAGVESVARCSVSSDDKFERYSASRRAEGRTIHEDGASVEQIRGEQKIDGTGGDRGEVNSSSTPLIGEWYTPS